MYPRILRKMFIWAKAHGYCGIEFVQRGEHIWVFIQCWDSSHFRRVCVSSLDRFSSNVNEEVVVLGQIIDAIGPDVRVVSVQGGPHALVEAYINFLGSRYQQKLTEYPLFHLLLVKRCLQRTASSLFGNLDPYSMRVHCEQAEGGGDSWLDGFSASIGESHYKQQSWHARTCWLHGQFCGNMAFDCFVPEGDSAKRWRR